MKIFHQLTWYQKHGDAFVGEEIIDLKKTKKLQDIFREESDEDELMHYTYQVKEKHIKELSKIVNHRFNFENYDYFIESFSR